MLIETQKGEKLSICRHGHKEQDHRIQQAAAAQRTRMRDHNLQLYR
jgi:hypothetical protein